MNKRIVKSPKLYFYDTGLLCHLLGIKSIASLKKNNAYTALFENWVITKIKKIILMQGKTKACIISGIMLAMKLI